MSEPGAHWKEMPTSQLSGNGYQNAVRGWRNEQTDAEVIVFRTENTGLDELDEAQEWAVSHPYTNDNVHFAPTKGAAVDFALGWMKRHETPENAY
jgi:hypothetical protein